MNGSRLREEILLPSEQSLMAKAENNLRSALDIRGDLEDLAPFIRTCT